MAQRYTILANWQKRGLALIMLLSLTHCASIPEREFTTYLSQFEQVRKASEWVLMDYALAKKERLALEQSQLPLLRETLFKTEQIIVAEDSIDDIALRFKAWETVDAYNQTLVSLLAGNSVKTEDKTKTLLRTLIGLSGQAILSAASNLSPALTAIKNISAEIASLYEKNKILALLIKVSPIISQQFIAQMRNDSELFYQLRYGLNSYRYQQINAKIGRKIAEFVKLAYTLNQEQRVKNIVPLLTSLNTSLATIPANSTGRGFKIITLKSQFGKDNSPQTVAQLVSLKEQILILIEQGKQQNKILATYRQMLGAYVRMLNELDFQLKLMLEVAKQQQSIEVLMANDFSDTVLRMRQAYLYYQNNNSTGAY